MVWFIGITHSLEIYTQFHTLHHTNDFTMFMKRCFSTSIYSSIVCCVCVCISDGVSIASNISIDGFSMAYWYFDAQFFFAPIAQSRKINFTNLKNGISNRIFKWWIKVVSIDTPCSIPNQWFQFTQQQQQNGDRITETIKFDQPFHILNWWTRNRFGAG